MKLNIKPQQEQQQQLQQSPMLVFDDILELLSKPAPIQVQFGKKNELNPNFKTVQLQEIAQSIQLYTEQGTNYLLNNELKEGIESLRMSESLLNVCFQKNIQINDDIMLQSLVNLGVSYYKIGLLEESLVCLENCLVTLRNKKDQSKNQSQNEQVYKFQKILNNKEYQQKMIKKIEIRKFKCKLHIQCCLILSEMTRHEEALAHAKYAIHIAFKLFLDSIILCYQSLIEQKNPEQIQVVDNSRPQTEESSQTNEDQNYDQKTVMMLSILMEIFGKLKSLNFSQEQSKKEFLIDMLQKSCGQIEFLKVDMKYLFDNLTQKSDDLQKSSILQLLQLQFISGDDLNQCQQIKEEISEDSLFSKIANLSACFYCASTESRFIEERNMMHMYSSNIVLESEYMLSKSVMIAYSFLKNDIPFVIQIIRVYQKFHNINSQIIAENEEYDSTFKPQYKNLFIKVSLGITGLDNFIPIIRVPLINQQVNNQQQQKPQTVQQNVRQTKQDKNDKFKISQKNSKNNKQQEKLEKIYMHAGPNIKNISQEKPSSADTLKPVNDQQIQKQQEKNANLVQLSKIYKNSVLQTKQKKQVCLNNFINPAPKQLVQIQKKRSTFKQQINLVKPQAENIIINNNINFLINEKNWEKGNKIMQDVMSNIKISNQKSKKNTFLIKKL